MTPSVGSPEGDGSEAAGEPEDAGGCPGGSAPWAAAEFGVIA
ncbi:hypothetical protein [Brevibacterium aurantiacum]|nr:hypothetical protein [Brevibacterium aurantiacum]